MTGWRPSLALALCAAVAAPAVAQDSAAEGERPGWWGLLDANWLGVPRLSGSLTYQFTSSRSGHERSRVQMLLGNITGETYIYQPWFATASGTLRLSTASTHSRIFAPDAFGPVETSSTADQTLNGALRVNLFPRSRFPFEFRFDRTDSRMENGVSPLFDYRTQVIGITQRYRPVGDAYNLLGRYEHRTQAGNGFRDVQDQLDGELGLQWKNNALTVSGSLMQARRLVSEERSRFETLVSRHQLRSNDEFSVDTTFNATRTIDAAPGRRSDVSLVQLSSVGLWRPGEASSLAVTGSVRALMLTDHEFGGSTENLTASAGATYQVTPRLQVSGNASAGFFQSGGSHGQSGSLAGNVSWQGEGVEFWGARYDRYAGLSASAGAMSSSQANESNASVAATAGHTLTRNWPLGAQGALQLTATQTLSSNVNRSSDPFTQDLLRRATSRNLLNSAAATWSITREHTSAYARASWSNALELDGTRNRFQLFNFQLSGTWEFGRFETLTGELTLQRTRSHAAEAQPAGSPVEVLWGNTTTTSASGEVTYRNNRLFNVPGLRFSSRLRLAQDVLKEAGTLPSLPDVETKLWESRLDWAVGRMNSGVQYRVSQIDGKPLQSLFFRVQRSFGD